MDVYYKEYIGKLQDIRVKRQVEAMADKSCDICGSEVDTDKLKMFMTFNMCPECIAKETKLQDTVKATENERVNAMHVAAAKILSESRAIDSSIRVNGDVFNARTIAIVELEKAINSDETIPAEQKYFMLAKEISDRRNKLEVTISERKSELDNLQTEQIVHQRKLNELAEKLSKEERDKLKLIAINYKPQLTKDKVKIPVIGKKSENLALVLRDFPKIDMADAKLASLYLDKMNRTKQVMTTADAVAFVNSVK